MSTKLRYEPLTEIIQGSLNSRSAEENDQRMFIMHCAIYCYADLLFNLIRNRQLKAEAAVQWCSLEKCSENMQQIYKRTPMLKYDFSKVAMQLY